MEETKPLPRNQAGLVVLGLQILISREAAVAILMHPDAPYGTITAYRENYFYRSQTHENHQKESYQGDSAHRRRCGVGSFQSQ